MSYYLRVATGGQALIAFLETYSRCRSILALPTLSFRLRSYQQVYPPKIIRNLSQSPLNRQGEKQPAIMDLRCSSLFIFCLDDFVPGDNEFRNDVEFI